MTVTHTLRHLDDVMEGAMSLSGDVIVDFLTIEESHVVALIKEKKSFVIDNVPRLSMGEAVEKMEKLIEGAGLRSRVYAKGRSAVIAGLAIPTIPTITAGAATAAFIAGHNALTFNPDYEIATNRTTGTLTLTYTKWESVAEATSAMGDSVSSAADKVSEAVGSAASKLKSKLFS